MCVCVTRVPLCPLHSTYISTYTYTIPATFLPLHYCLFLPSFRFEFSRTLCESLLSPLIQDFGSASVELPDKAGKTQLSLSPNYTSLPFAFVQDHQTRPDIQCHKGFSRGYTFPPNPDLWALSSPRLVNPLSTTQGGQYTSPWFRVFLMTRFRLFGQI